KEIYTEDLIADKVISLRDLRSPSEQALGALQQLAQLARSEHNRGDPRARKRPLPEEIDDEHWRGEARSELFKSKRAGALATLLAAKQVLARTFRREPTEEGLSRLLQASEGRRVVAQILRRAKAESVGIAIADITVCGAIPPYSHLLGGKLVAMLL